MQLRSLLTAMGGLLAGSLRTDITAKAVSTPESRFIAWPVVAEMPPEAADRERGISHIRQMDASFDPAQFVATAAAMFTRVEGAFGQGDMGALRDVLTPELQAEMQARCDRLRAEGRTNRVEQIEVDRAEVTEAWQETGQDFVTVYLSASMLDYVVDARGGLVEGSNSAPVSELPSGPVVRFLNAASERTDQNLSLSSPMLVTTQFFYDRATDGQNSAEGAVLAVPYVVDTPRVQALISHSASQALGRPVKFASLSVSVFPLPAVMLKDLRVSEDPRFGTKPFLTIGTGSLRLRVWPLLSGRVEFSELVLQKLQVTLAMTFELQ